MFFSLIIASKNEEKDIHLSLESSINQTYQNKEIIVVDDSSDNTKEVVNSYFNRGVRLINGNNHGCCEARNLGIKSSKGDIIVFLTADTILDKNYLRDISLSYDLEDPDMLTVNAVVSNQDNMFARFIDKQSKKETNHPNFNPFTTQGYSVKKKSALEVGLISGTAYPFNFCRDWTLGEKLYKKEYKLVHNSNISVYHKAPQELSDYWTVRLTRGLMSAYQPFYFFNKKLSYLFFKFIVKSLISVIKVFTIIPAIIEITSVSKFSSKKIDFFIFIIPYLIQEYAIRYGEFKGLYNIIKKNK
jgi:glycosyltransferase involved in cell wall biosynthesis